MKFRKKPVVIEATQWNGTKESYDEIIEFITGKQFWLKDGSLYNADNLNQPIIIHTMEGDMTASVGDWIIRGIQGEFYPCNSMIFEATYESCQEETV